MFEGCFDDEELDEEEPCETDHIWPKAEGGPKKDPRNLRPIPRSENRSKGAEMPDIKAVLDSSDPAWLAVQIDRHSIEEGFKNRRNKNKGFGGLPRL